MGTEQQALAVSELKRANDVAHLQRCAVEGVHHIALLVHLRAEAFQLLHQIISTLTVGFAIGHTWAERHLAGHITVGTIGIERGHIHNAGVAPTGLSGRFATHSDATRQQDGKGRPHKDLDGMSVHSHSVTYQNKVQIYTILSKKHRLLTIDN